VDLCLGEVDGEGIVLFKKLVDAAKSPSCITISLIMWSLEGPVFQIISLPAVPWVLVVGCCVEDLTLLKDDILLGYFIEFIAREPFMDVLRGV